MKNRNSDQYLSGYLKVVSFNLILFILLLGIIEIFLGNWLNPNRLNWGNIIKDYEIHSESGRLIYSRDKWGFRGRYPDVENIDILTIGGSTTDQRRIPEGQTFQDILQREFKKHGKDVYVVNAGIDGQSTFGHVKNFDWWFPSIPKLNVKYFLFYIGINDFYKDANFRYDDLLGESRKSIKQLIKDRSALYYLYSTIRGIVLAYAYGLLHNTEHDHLSTEDWTDQPNYSNYNAIMKKRLDAYEQRLNILISKVESMGSTSIFVTQSMRGTYDFIDGQLYGRPKFFWYENHHLNGVDYYYMSRLLNERTKEVCLDNGIIFIDLDQELDFDRKVDLADYSHNTLSGVDKIGKYLYEQLRSLF